MKSNSKNRIQNKAKHLSKAVPEKKKILSAKLAGLIDHTLLKPDATLHEIENLCNEAKKYGFASVCVNPGYVKLCCDLLNYSDVKVCTVIGFPLGATSTAAKVYEAERAIKHGADEVDMVINIGMLKSGEYDYVEHDIAAVAETAHRMNAIIKVIIETGLLNKDEIIKACVLVKHAGADFIKTCTGFSRGAAKAADVALMRKVIGPELGIKASGGVRSKKKALMLIASGATRIGTSSGVKIIKG